MQACAQPSVRAFTAAAPARASRRAQRIAISAQAGDREGAGVVERIQGAVKGCLLGAAAAALLAAAPAELSQSPLQLGVAPAEAVITAENITNAKALLRYALPIDNKPIRKIQRELESISEALRVPGSKSLGPIARSVRAAQSVIDREENSIVGALAPAKKEAGLAALAGLKTTLVEFQGLVEAQDKQAVPIKQQQALDYVGAIEEAMVKEFPFKVPAEYSNLPQLKGRATVEMEIKFSEPRDENSTGGKMVIVADGYNAPLSAGAWIDLVSRGFYDGMEVQRADGFVVQTGKPADGEGFVVDGEVRRVPFEVMVRGDKEPVYEETLEELGRFRETPVLPFNAYGTIALARAEFEPNSASSQFFLLLKESELTPTGANLLDGRYAVLGYTIENSQLLKEVQVGDTIVYAKVIDGLENLQQPK